jgi:hypothetical protein
MITFIVVFLPIARAIAKKAENQSVGGGVPPEVAARLERMEQALDSVALEVERIAEGQRFTTRLLSERLNEREALPSSEAARSS